MAFFLHSELINEDHSYDMLDIANLTESSIAILKELGPSNPY